MTRSVESGPDFFNGLLGRVTPLLVQAEDALIAARRTSEDIDRRKELREGDPNLNLVWKLTGEQQQLTRDDNEQEEA